MLAVFLYAVHKIVNQIDPSFFLNADIGGSCFYRLLQYNSMISCGLDPEENQQYGTNDTNENKTVEVLAGQGVAQGIFMQYGIVEDDDASEIRNGGFGSTTK